MGPLSAAALIGAGGDLLGGILGSKGQKSANAKNIAFAREQMDFQERMSSTAYQRAAKDLDAAGLNRILALGSPASSPGGQTARMENTKALLAKGVSTAAHSAAALRKTDAEISQIKANTSLTQTRGLIAKHGEEIASIGADIARTVRSLIGNKSPEEVAAIIKTQIQNATGLITNVLERGDSTAKNIQSELQNVRDDISIFINDQIDKFPKIQTRETNYDRYKKETKGKDISFREWLKRQ